MQEAAPRKKRRVNVRTPEVMERVQAEVANHYESSIVERVKALGGLLTIGNTTIRLAKQFGFCYGVERAIDLAYASRRVFPENRIFLIGEIIHNPEVNRQLEDMKIVSLPWREMDEQYDDLGENDVVIVPAFGAPISFMDKVESQGCLTVDTTCGDVMKVWKRVRGFAKAGVTSIIHGKADHEETRATASRAAGEDGNGNFLIVLTLEDVDFVCDYIRDGGERETFFQRFEGRMSPDFDPDVHLQQVGVANQTTMLKSETEEIQRRVRVAIEARDEGSNENFLVFDTICGATQERQDALFELLKHEMNMLIVVGGYNSSNTTHLVEIGEKELPTFFIRSSDCLVSLEEIVHYDLHQEEEVTSYSEVFEKQAEVVIGITAGASCPSNLIEDTIVKVFQLRGISEAAVREA
ncbi:MAG: 4-hydroxy-3-methylbut-2-enyl diphosphate reductase [Verrucomicrobiales bacterium]|nr:4-hydroxy-3-methylbut-2-enyl diphosphate reductase [Verrucomicrobiales bacterium]